jgi:hypothetical protein
MTDLKTMHLVMGVRAEQSLRDAVRAAAESSADDADDLVLAPAGRKDWIAGVRIGEAASYREIAEIGKKVLKRLLRLESRQRIRSENVRLWIVPPPVPVFRDPLPSEAAASGAADLELGGEDEGEDEDGAVGWTGDDSL